MTNSTLKLFILLGILVIGVSCAGDDDSSSEASAKEDDDTNDDYGADDDRNDDDIDDDTEPPSAGSRLIFDLTPGMRNIPFPSFVFLDEDQSSPTGWRMELGAQATTYIDKILRAAWFILKGLEDLDGFALASPVWFPVDSPPDRTRFPDHLDPGIDDAVFCVVLENEDHPHHGEFWALDVDYMDDRGIIQAYPHRPFYENTRYACVVTRRLRTLDGEEYETPGDLLYIMSSEPDPDHPDYGFLEEYREKLSGHFADLFDQYDLSREDLIGATIFHTQWTTHDLLSIREQIENMAADNPPRMDDWVRIEQDREYVDSIWEATYMGPTWMHEGKFRYDENGDPLPGEPQRITLRITLPQPGVNGYEPPYPIVMFGHGINGDRLQADKVAEKLAGFGVATAAIDWLFHGDRIREIPGLPDWMISAVQSIQFINILDPIKMRDNFRQGVSDLMWLKHVIRGLDGLDLAPYDTGGDGRHDLDTSRIYFAGMSLGAMQGGIFAAVEPDIDTFLFNVGASDWRAVALEGDVGKIVMIVVRVLDAIIPYALEDDVMISMELFLNMVDAGDPYSYARHVMEEPLFGEAPRRLNILHQMAAYDDTLGGPGSARMAWSLNLTLLNPFIYPIEDLAVADAPFDGPATFQYDTDYHPFLISHNDFFEAANLQAGNFFRSACDNGTATIINPLEE